MALTASLAFLSLGVGLALLDGSMFAWIPGVRLLPIWSAASIVGFAWAPHVERIGAWTIAFAALADVFRGGGIGGRSLLLLATTLAVWPMIVRQRNGNDIGSTLGIAAALASAEYAAVHFGVSGFPDDLASFGALTGHWAIAIAWTSALALLLRRALRVRTA